MINLNLQDDDGCASFDDNGDTQTRTHDAANELTDISGSWIDPTYDAAGNMISGPKPGAETTEYKFVYDAWNRLVKVTDSAGTTTIAEYRYDGFGRRIAKLVPNGQNWNRTDYYYDEAWQCMEQRYGQGQAKESVPDTPNVQYLWDVRYVDAPVLRWRSVSGTLNEVLYFCNDANMNVTALVDTSGTVVERYVYDPYGKATCLDLNWANGQATSRVGNEILYCGYPFDPETGLGHVRHRYYHPTLGRWITRDPAGYVTPLTVYEYAIGSPCAYVDYTGRAPHDTATPSKVSGPSPYTITDNGKAYSGLTEPIAGDTWSQILEDKLDKCPPQLTLTEAIESRLALALTKTLAEKVEYGGIITKEGSGIVVWGPVKGDPKGVIVTQSAPPNRSAEGEEYLGYYHTHPPEVVITGMGPQREPRFSGEDIEGWWRHNQVAIVRGKCCTLALLKTTAWADSTKKSLEDFSKIVQKYTADLNPLDFLNEPNNQAKYDKVDQLVRSKHNLLGAAASGVGVCYYRKCGTGPNEGQKTLDLVTGK